MTTEQLIAEVKSGGFQQYEESGLINDISLRRWIRNELKRFGSNLMSVNEEVLRIRNYKAKLPEHFWRLKLAVHCEPDCYEMHDPENVIQNTFLYRERVEGFAEWDNQSASFSNTNHRYVREDLVLNKGYLKLQYKNPTLIRLTKGFNKSVCDSQCPNFRPQLVSNSIYEANIVNDYMNFNVETGLVYIQYLGLAEDENGDFLIPTTQHNRLQEYLIYYCRLRILEDLIVGGDDPNKAQLLSYYDSKTREAFMLAMTEAKFEGLGTSWRSSVRNEARKQTLKYDVMLPYR